MPESGEGHFVTWMADWARMTDLLSHFARRRTQKSAHNSAKLQKSLSDSKQQQGAQQQS
jgi:hypothetical protein